MSKPIIPGQAPAQLEPAEQIQRFVELLRPGVDPVIYARLAERTRELAMDFSNDELTILAALDTPAKVQEFLNTQIYYNYDHSSVDQQETSMSPRQILRTAHAHCFEGALFGYAVNFLHGHAPRLSLLEASQDPDHNLVVIQDKQTGLYGAVAHSGWPHLDGRPPEYPTLSALVESYVPYYISDLTSDPNDLTLVGYSEPFDLTAKFGTAWIGSTEMLWDIYYTYIDASVRFHYLFDRSGETHLYPLIRALQEGWIQLDAQGKPFVNTGNLAPAARAAWDAFWRVFDPSIRPVRGQAHEIEMEFMRLTGTTPIDLQTNADDFVDYLSSGHTIPELTGSKTDIG